MTEHFSNQRLSSEQLPTLQELPFLPVSPDYLKVVLIQSFLGLLFPLALLGVLLAFMGVTDEPSPLPFAFDTTNLGLIAILCVVFMLMWLLLIVKSVRAKAYSVREHDIAFKEGWLFKKMVIQPLLRVQHVEVSQNPLEARWDLATLKLYSAGGFRYTFAIPGLKKDVAERLQQHVLDYQEIHRE